MKTGSLVTESTEDKPEVTEQHVFLCELLPNSVFSVSKDSEFQSDRGKCTQQDSKLRHCITEAKPEGTEQG